MFRKAAILLIALTINWVSAKHVNPDFSQDVISNVETRDDSDWFAQLGQFPHHASLRVNTSFGFPRFCSGAIVHSNWLLTAATCLTSAVSVTVRAGSIESVEGEYTAETTEWYIHSQYNTTLPFEQPNNIAIVHLKSPVVFTPNLQAVRIQPSADVEQDYTDVTFKVSEFKRRFQAGPNEMLRWLFVRGISNTACGSIFGSLVDDATVCARQESDTLSSHCLDDDGAPLVSDDNNAPVLVGIASFFGVGPWPCGGGFPAGYVRVGAYHKWITEITGLDFDVAE